MTRATRHLFIVPGPEAPPSGGNRYNERLLAALAARPDATAARSDRDARLATSLRAPCDVIWLDSLYLELAPDVRAWAPRETRLHLLAHSLPSQLAWAAGHADAELPARERRALSAVQAALAPSETMAAWLHARAPELPVHVIPPGIERAPAAPRGAGELRALVVANLTPNKGLLPLLRSLRRELAATDALTLRCVGRRDLDPEYTRACDAELALSPELARNVCWLGGLPFAVVLEELARAHVLISASRVESYGMAIAEARAAGCVVIARRGGHVEHLVTPATGGELVEDDRALAQAFLSLARAPDERTRRLALADQMRLPPRSWTEVAREVSAIC